MQTVLEKLKEKVSLYEIGLDMGVSEGTLRRYLYGYKLKQSTLNIIEGYLKCHCLK